MLHRRHKLINNIASFPLIFPKDHKLLLVCAQKPLTAGFWDEWCDNHRCINFAGNSRPLDSNWGVSVWASFHLTACTKLVLVMAGQCELWQKEAPFNKRKQSKHGTVSKTVLCSKPGSHPVFLVTLRVNKSFCPTNMLGDDTRENGFLQWHCLSGGQFFPQLTDGQEDRMELCSNNSNLPTHWPKNGSVTGDHVWQSGQEDTTSLLPIYTLLCLC